MWMFKGVRSMRPCLAVLLLMGTVASGCLSSGSVSLTQGSLNVSLSASSAGNMSSSKVTSAVLAITGAPLPSGGSAVTR
jgi:hypothetical protein